MARQSTTPVPFGRTNRIDKCTTMTSARAGKVAMIAQIPVLPGDSASGRIGVDLDLAEMPKPLLNGVVANVQAWFVPQPALPRFAGYDEWLAAFQQRPIKQLGSPDRPAQDLYDVIDESLALDEVADSDFYRTLGIHIPAGDAVNTDLIDAFWLVYNFRLAAHSSLLDLAPFYQEDPTAALEFPRAFWPAGSRSSIVGDYERALVVGSYNLDVAAGLVPVLGIGMNAGASPRTTDQTQREAGSQDETTVYDNYQDAANVNSFKIEMDQDDSGNWRPAIYANMQGQEINVTLESINKARETQSFARMAASMRGNDFTGLDRENVAMAHLLQGLIVPPEYLRQPWILDSDIVPFGMVERYATDAANLDQSVTEGTAQAKLSINVPKTDEGGMIIVTCEVLPERIDEAGIDPYLHVTSRDHMPNALRDVQRVEPVDLVSTKRVDARRTTAHTAYGWEPMNNRWNREFTRLGGIFYQDDAANPFKESRSAIWMTNIVDPLFTQDHYLVPEDFPHDVFSDTQAPAVEITVGHQIALNGLTQFGDVLIEANDDYQAIEDATG